MISMQKLRGILGEVNLRTMSRLLAGLVVAVGLLALATGAWASSAYWNGAVDDDYNNLGNWAGPPASVPGTGEGETATFGDTGAVFVLINVSTAHALGFNFTNTVGEYYSMELSYEVNREFTGLTTVATGGIVNLGTWNLDSRYTLTGTRSFDIGSNQLTSVSSIIANADGTAGGINKTGGGAPGSATQRRDETSREINESCAAT